MKHRSCTFLPALDLAISIDVKMSVKFDAKTLSAPDFSILKAASSIIGAIAAGKTTFLKLLVGQKNGTTVK